MRTGRAPERAEHGFSYVVVLSVLAVMSVGTVAMASLWSADARREREQELLRIGSLYARAIAAYYEAAPGGVKRFPSSLEDLLLDRRYIGTVRHLRRLYADPTQPGKPWGLVMAPDGTIRGVHSVNAETPLRREPIDLGFATLPRVGRYSEWQFVPRVSS